MYPVISPTGQITWKLVETGIPVNRQALPPQSDEMAQQINYLARYVCAPLVELQERYTWVALSNLKKRYVWISSSIRIAGKISMLLNCRECEAGYLCKNLQFHGRHVWSVYSLSSPYLEHCNTWSLCCFPASLDMISIPDNCDCGWKFLSADMMVVQDLLPVSVTIRDVPHFLHLPFILSEILLCWQYNVVQYFWKLCSWQPKSASLQCVLDSHTHGDFVANTSSHSDAKSRAAEISITTRP